MASLWCENGKHAWSKEGRGRPPKNCPEHRDNASHILQPNITNSNHTLDITNLETLPTDNLPSEILTAIEAAEQEEKMVKTYCKGGDHWYQRERRRGRVPVSCPEHSSAISTSEPTKGQANAITAILENPRALSCRCGISSQSTAADLRAIVNSCTDPQFICPTLDAVRRIML